MHRSIASRYVFPIVSPAGRLGPEFSTVLNGASLSRTTVLLERYVVLLSARIRVLSCLFCHRDSASAVRTNPASRHAHAGNACQPCVILLSIVYKYWRSAFANLGVYHRWLAGEDLGSLGSAASRSAAPSQQQRGSSPARNILGSLLAIGRAHSCQDVLCSSSLATPQAAASSSFVAHLHCGFYDSCQTS